MAANVGTSIDMGPGTHAVPLSLFRDNRLRVCNALKSIPSNEIGNNEKTFVLLQGGDSINLYNTDVEYLFRQVSSQLIFFLHFCRSVISQNDKRIFTIILHLSGACLFA